MDSYMHTSTSFDQGIIFVVLKKDYHIAILWSVNSEVKIFLHNLIESGLTSSICCDSVC